MQATNWSRDGQSVLYYTSDPNPTTDIWALPAPLILVRCSLDRLVWLLHHSNTFFCLPLTRSERLSKRV